MNDRIEIQAQDTSGMWRTYHVTMNDSQRILAEMRSIQSRYPNYRVRAIDQNGRIVDIL
jgi:hypothetical protein